MEKGFVHITLTATVSDSDYHDYQRKGEANIDITLPIDTVEDMNPGNLLQSLIPVAFAEHKHNLAELEKENK